MIHYDFYFIFICSKYNTLYKTINTTESEISSLNHYYIDPKLIEILKENGINLKHKYTDIDKFLNDKNNQNEKIAFTMNLFNIEYLRRKGCITCFVNNHSNDNIDYTTDYECLIEDFPKQLEKIINK